jgi:hypothetical protein
MFNLKYNNEQPKLYINQAEIYDAQTKFAKEKPILVIQPNGGVEGQPNNNYSWSRDIPPFLTEKLVKKLSNKYYIYHLCRPNQLKFEGAEQVSLPWRESFALLALSTARLLIDSYSQHAAAALGLSSVVCWIGTKPDKLGYNLFEGLLIRINSSNDVSPIKNFKLLCYVIYILSGILIKYNLWFSDSNVKKGLINPSDQKIIINTLIDLLNSILEINSKKTKNFLYEMFSSRFF